MITKMQMFIRSLIPVCFLAVSLAAAGCSSPTSAPDYSELGLVEVTGIATLDAKPLSGVTLEFVNAADESYSYGYTDAQGNYSLMFDSRTAGTIPGEKAIRVRTGKPAGVAEAGGEAASPGVAIGEEVDAEDPDAAPAAADGVPACYTSTGSLTVIIPQRDCRVEVRLASDCKSGEASVID